MPWSKNVGEIVKGGGLVEFLHVSEDELGVPHGALRLRVTPQPPVGRLPRVRRVSSDVDLEKGKLRYSWRYLISLSISPLSPSSPLSLSLSLCLSFALSRCVFLSFSLYGFLFLSLPVSLFLSPSLMFSERGCN